MNDELKPSEGDLNGGDITAGTGWRIRQQLALMKAIESANKGHFAEPGEVERFFKQFGSESAPA